MGAEKKKRTKDSIFLSFAEYEEHRKQFDDDLENGASNRELIKAWDLAVARVKEEGFLDDIDITIFGTSGTDVKPD